MAGETGMNEETFREILIAFMRESGCLNEGTILTNFIIVGTSASLDDPDVSAVSVLPSHNFPFAYQIGALEYALTRHKYRVEQDEEL